MVLGLIVVVASESMCAGVGHRHVMRKHSLTGVAHGQVEQISMATPKVGHDVGTIERTR